ncbi:MAG TPA: hypothetical protein VGL36_35800 [Kribbella sp.]
MIEPAHLKVVTLRADLGQLHVDGSLAPDPHTSVDVDQAMRRSDQLLAEAEAALRGVVATRAPGPRLSNETFIGAASELQDAIRMLSFDTRATIAAPLACDVLDHLEPASTSIGQAAKRIAAGLRDSLTEYDVYEEKDETRDPETSVAEAEQHLARATDLAQQLAAELKAAKAAIDGQVY